MSPMPQSEACTQCAILLLVLPLGGEGVVMILTLRDPVLRPGALGGRWWRSERCKKLLTIDILGRNNKIFLPKIRRSFAYSFSVLLGAFAV